jgi:hypothetical protein
MAMSVVLLRYFLVSNVYRLPWLRCVPFSANFVQPQETSTIPRTVQHMSSTYPSSS